MIRSAFAVALLAALASQGCVSREQGTPAVHQLAALQARDQLDADRLACVTAALVPVVEEAQGQLPEVRAAQAAVLAGAVQDHARSVQAGMRASDASSGALRLAVESRRSAHHARAEGDTRLALLMQDAAADYQRYAESQLHISVRGPTAGQLLSDAEAQLLVEYARLRLDRVLSPTEEPSERLAEIEREHPDIMNVYAVLMLELYQDPALPCAVRTP